MTAATYGLARLRRNDLHVRRPHSNPYDPTPDGLRFALFYTKVHDRVLTPLFAADQPQAPPQLRGALRTLDQHIDQRMAHARLPAAAYNSAQLPNPYPPALAKRRGIPSAKGSLAREW